MVVARCHTRSVWRWAGVRWMVSEVLRPRAIQRPRSKKIWVLFVGSTVWVLVIENKKMSSRLPRIPQNRVRRVTNLWAELCEVAHTFVEKKADCYRVACYGRKVHLKPSTSTQLLEISSPNV